jgi:hypothetical protein
MNADRADARGYFVLVNKMTRVRLIFGEAFENDPIEKAKTAQSGEQAIKNRIFDKTPSENATQLA